MHCFVSPLEKFDSDLWFFHIEVPKSVAEEIISSTGRRVVCTINNAHTFHCAIMQWTGGKHFINLNKSAREMLGLRLGDAISAVLVADESRYGLPMSEEFEEVLRQDAESERLFHGLTPGLQRSLIYYSDNVKSSHIKVRRALVVMEHLKIHGGRVDFRSLSDEVKAANREARRL